MKVRSIIAAGLIVADIMFSFSFSAQAQNRNSDVGCNATLQAVKNKIQKNRKVKVVQMDKFDISRNYISYPQNRPYSYSFTLEGSATESVLNSVKFLTTITRDIIKNCPSISRVYFVQYGSDNGVSYGLLKNNEIEGFPCINFDTNNLENNPKKLPWGYEGCL